MKKFDIAGRSKVWFIMSLLVIIPGIFCMFTKGFNFGIDFTGGTIIDMKFEQPVSIAQVRASLAKFGLDGATIQLSGAQSDVLESQDVMVRAADMEEDQRKEALYQTLDTLRERFGEQALCRGAKPKPKARNNEKQQE